jgi:tetratricopeptide (TPR) repeat protein
MIYKRSIFLALAFAAFFAFPGAAKCAEHAERVRDFLIRTPLSAGEQSDILEGIKAASTRTEPSRTEWLMHGDGQIYSIVLRPAQKDARSNVQVKLEEMARNQANLRAHYLLYLRAMPRSRKARYSNEDSVAEALASWDGNREEEQRLTPDLSVSIVSGGWAFALARTKGELLDSLSAQIEDMPDDALDTAYCLALYPKARALFDAGEYENALPVYLELHSLRWARPGAYLDAAECFLHTGDKKGAAYLTNETVSELGDDMNSALLERAGDILLESGEDEGAERLYRLAIEKLRQEP